MVLPIYVSLERLDQSFVEASRDLGAGPVATLRQIVLPLAAPGILSGIVLVFIPVMGEYLIPILLGGGKTYFLGNALADLFLQSRNWPFGSALAAVFVAGMIVLVARLPGDVAVAWSAAGAGSRACCDGRRTSAGRPASARLERLGERAAWTYTALVFAFLFLPIVIVVIYQFNAGRHVTELTGSRPSGTATAWSDRFLINALRNSLTIATHHGRAGDDPGDGVGAGDGPAGSRRLRWLFELLDLRRDHRAGHRHRHRDADLPGDGVRLAEPMARVSRRPQGAAVRAGDGQRHRGAHAVHDRHRQRAGPDAHARGWTER